MQVRDLSEYKCLREAVRAELADTTQLPLNRICKLKVLYAALSRRLIQERKSHDPLEDVMLPLALYYAYRDEIEREVQARHLESGYYGMYPGHIAIDSNKDFDYDKALRSRREFELGRRTLTPDEEDEFFNDFVY